MSRQTRRTFLKRAATAGVGAGLVIAGTKASGKVLGANDTIRVGVAGIHGRGGRHIDVFARMDGVDVTYLIDPDSTLFEGRIERVKAQGGNTPTCVQDIREALDDDNLDVVSVATCNHWHSLITVWSCMAGKDVYVEKPCSHNVFEGRQCVEAARKYGRIVQHGTQSRSKDACAHTAAAIASGKYGKLLVSKGYCCKNRWSIGFKEIKEPPPELDFNLWLGPAPMQPYHENLVHYNWHWFWDTGNGDIGNQGVHQMDLARWAIPGATLPKSVVSMGGRWVNEPDFKDQGETPNMELCVYDYGDTLLVFETRGLVGSADYPKYPRKVANEYYLEEGVIKDWKFYPNGSDKAEPLVEVDYKLGPMDLDVKEPHFSNFIECVRSRKLDDLNAEILDGHLSAALCHLGNISYRLGKEVPFGTGTEIFGDNKHVQHSLRAIRENTTAIGVDPDKATWTVGPKLAFDADAEKFADNPEADALLTRDYREPFVVPKIG